MPNKANDILPFWEIMNTALAADGLPGLHLGEVRPIFERALSEARRQVRERHILAAAQRIIAP